MNWLAVALGGALGASCRYAVAIQLAGLTGRFPLATFIVNGAGSFLMGLGFVLIVERQFLPEVWRHFFLIGGLGALTTFSTYSLELVLLIQSQAWKLAAFYALGSVVTCILAVFLGMSFAKHFF